MGVHSTQFAIRAPQHDLLQPVLSLAAQTVRSAAAQAARAVALIAGVCGRTRQAVAEAELARGFGYDAALVSMTAFNNDPEKALLEHVATVARVLPVFGFYLQPAVGGRVLSYRFWRQFAEIPELVAIKIAPFNRYQTLDVVRAVIESGREDVALYTGNDDTIVLDLLTSHCFAAANGRPQRRIVGGLLGHWGVWTAAAVRFFEGVRRAAAEPQIDTGWLTRAAAVTDMNAALFDAAHGFRGCIPGILEVLRRQGLVASRRCLDPAEDLSPGQAEEISRVCIAYPGLTDDAFVAEHLDAWLS